MAYSRDISRYHNIYKLYLIKYTMKKEGFLYWLKSSKLFYFALILLMFNIIFNVFSSSQGVSLFNTIILILINLLLFSILLFIFYKYSYFEKISKNKEFSKTSKILLTTTMILVLNVILSSIVVLSPSMVDYRNILFINIVITLLVLVFIISPISVYLAFKKQKK